MKKVIYLIIAFALITLSVFAFMYNAQTDTFENNSLENKQRDELMEFSVSDYELEIATFPCDKRVGSVNNADSAMDKATELWLEKFGVVNGKQYDPLRNCPVEVAFDQRSNCWLVHGTLPENALGSVPYALIHSDGTVLAVWMG